jgi:hypothetical protein
LLVDGRSEEVQRGLDEIISLLGGISGGPGAGGPSSNSTIGRIGDNLNNGDPLPAIVDDIPTATSHLHHTEHVPHVVKALYNNDEVEFKIPGAKSDRDARDAKIRNIINANFGTYGDSIFKDGNKVNINETIMGRSNPYIDPADFMNIRKKIRSELKTWQESYAGVDKNYPFKGIYGESGEKPDKFSIEFPYHSSKNYKMMSSFGHGHSNSSGRKGGKKTRRKKDRKSKNKTIKYKRNKNKKQSKKK